LYGVYGPKEPEMRRLLTGNYAVVGKREAKKADVGQNSKLDSRSKAGISIEIKTVGLRGEAGAVKKNADGPI
jgi:hypothetical protein